MFFVTFQTAFTKYASRSSVSETIKSTEICTYVGSMYVVGSFLIPVSCRRGAAPRPLRRARNIKPEYVHKL